jgi:hypothetical protein
VHRVEFRLDEGVPIGVLSRGTPGDAAPIEIARFAGEDEFEGVMDDFMMRALELSELKSRQRYSHDTLAQTVGSGWVGYSKALHIAGSQPILLGDEIFGGLPGRLLQMFLGIPYAELMIRTTLGHRAAIPGRGYRRAAVAARCHHKGDSGVRRPLPPCFPNRLLRARDMTRAPGQRRVRPGAANLGAAARHDARPRWPALASRLGSLVCDRP